MMRTLSPAATSARIRPRSRSALAPSLPGALALSVWLTGCGYVLWDDTPPVTAALDVYNRTETAIMLLAADGEPLPVPACGHARDADFRIDEVKVGSNGLYARAFGMGADYGGKDLTLVEYASVTRSDMPVPGPPPDPLPPCSGTLEVQPGVPLND